MTALPDKDGPHNRALDDDLSKQADPCLPFMVPNLRLFEDFRFPEVKWFTGLLRINNFFLM